jgi:large subunit ribosomal protein L19
MNKKPIVKKLEATQLKTNIPEFQVGDTVKVHVRIIEGDKERIQVFQGTVIARKGTGASETFSVHRVAYGEGMERVFPLHSPRIAKIEVVKHGDVRRSKLYYLRGTSGKKSKVKGRIGGFRQPAASKQVEAQAEETELNSTSEPHAEEAATTVNAGDEVQEEKAVK